MKWQAHFDQDVDVRGLLRFIQEESQMWREHCFPPQHRSAIMQALGVAEEAGELAHAILKMEQGIRGSEAQHVNEAIDAVGDIIIYLSGIASSLNFDLETAVRSAWSEVANRDWSKHKETGIEDARASGGAGE